MLKNIKLKEKLEPTQMITYLFALTMILIFTCSDKYFNVGNWYLLPLIIIFIGSINIMYDIIKNRKIIDLDKMNYCMIFIAFYVLFSSLILRLPAKTDTVLSYGFLFMFLLILSLAKFNKNQTVFIIKSYIASAIIITIIMLIQRATPYPGVLRFSIYYSETGFYDVNFLAAYIAIPALLSLNNAMLREDKNGKIKYYLITALILIGVFLTGSRGGLVGFIIGALFIVLVNRGITLDKVKKTIEDKQFKKPKLKTVILVILCIFILYLLLPKELTDRFFGQSYNDGSNQKRLEHWMYSIRSFIKEPIFGAGITWTEEVIIRNFQVRYTSHNTFLGALVQLGLVGFIPFMMVFVMPIKTLWNSEQKSIIGLILALLFIMIMIEAQCSLILFIHLSIICIMERYTIREKTKIIL